MPPFFYFRPFDFHPDTREPDNRARFLFFRLPIEVEDEEAEEMLNFAIWVINAAVLGLIAIVVLLFVTGVF